MCIVLLAGCEQEQPASRYPVQNEAVRLETEAIRKAVDDFKSVQSKPNEIRVKLAFSVFDRRLQELETTAAMQSGDEKAATMEKIADLKHRREIHWARYVAPVEESRPVRVAEKIPRAPRIARAEAVEPTPVPPVAERVLPTTERALGVPATEVPLSSRMATRPALPQEWRPSEGQRMAPPRLPPTAGQRGWPSGYSLRTYPPQQPRRWGESRIQKSQQRRRTADAGWSPVDWFR